MGFKDMNRAFKVEIPPVDGITLLALRSVLNIVAAATDDKTHETFVSRATIGARSGARPTTVKRALEALERLGMISREIRYRENGSQSSSLIRFTPGGSSRDQGGSSVDRVGVLHGPPPGFSTDPPGVLHGPPYIDQSEDQSLDQSSTSDFDAFWDLWPKQLDWKGALTAWNEALKHTDAATILRAARDYRDSPGRPEYKFIPGPSRWLDRRGWLESLPEPPKPDKPRKRYQFNDETAEPMQTVQHGSDCGPGKHLRQPDGTCRVCDRRDIPEEEAFDLAPIVAASRTIPKNDEWMYR